MWPGSGHRSRHLTATLPMTCNHTHLILLYHLWQIGPFQKISHPQRLEPRGILWLRSCCHDRRQHHPGLWSRHCKKAGDRLYICSGFNRLYKVEGNTNGIFKIPPPLLVDNQFRTSKPFVKSTQHVLDIQDLNPVLHFLNCLYIWSSRTCLVAESSRQVPAFGAVLGC